MVKTPTLLVLAAGANTDYGYPTGLGLRDEILEGLGDTHSNLHYRLRSLGCEESDIKAFRSAFADSQLPTIDQFLEGCSEFAQIGKLVIASALLPYEKSGSLERRCDRLKWYDYLWDELRQDLESFTDNKLTIVSFNSDRSLEQCLGRALVEAEAKDTEPWWRFGAVSPSVLSP